MTGTATTDSTAPASAVVSPKVIASALAALAAPVVIATLDAIVAEGVLAASLGAWAPVVAAAISALSAAIAGYFTRDPRRV
jgi:hypothetical protein